MNLRRPAALARRFAGARGGVATVEFAINSLALILMIFAVINLGDLGLTLGLMKQGVESAVRASVVQTEASFAATGHTNACATAAQMAAYFNNVVAPIMPAATGSTTDGSPIVTYNWTNYTLLGTAPGTFLTINVAYRWTPIGLPNSFGGGIPLSMASTQMVIGTSGYPTSCS